MKKILLSGGAGFIGSELALSLLNDGYEVVVLDNLSPQIHGNPDESYLYQRIRNKVRFIHGDVRNSSDWEEALDGAEAVVHLAAETGTGQSMYEISRYADVNTGGTARLLDFLVNKPHRIVKVVVASSRAVYGEGRYLCPRHNIVFPAGRDRSLLESGDFECRCPHCNGKVMTRPTDEDSKINPSSVYGISKYNQEALVLEVCRSIGIPAVALRYQNVYGPGQSLSNPYTGILSIFSKLILNRQPINIFEDGLESRDFVYISDVVMATRLATESELGGSRVYNVGSGEAVSVLEIAGLLGKNYGIEPEIKVSGDFRLGDIRHNYADIERIEKELNFKPLYSVGEGISNFARWVTSRLQGIPADDYEKSLTEMQDKKLFIKGKSKT